WVPAWIVEAIMARLRMEARREVRDLGTARADGELAGVFGVEEGSLLLWRNYHIIHQGAILMNITETFPYEAFR
ncbi:MAG: chorismate pyruvate-lyase family protein, partial [Candidatus Hydrothermarchaeota archaeon]